MRFTLLSEEIRMFIKASMYPVLLAAPLVLSAAPVPSPQCPELIPASSVQLKDIPDDWVIYVAAPLYLHAAAPMYGPPEMKGDLADFKESRTKNAWSYTYTLDGAFPDGKWLQCTYGEHNQVTLSRRLSDETRECQFTYRKGAKPGQHEINVQCK
jgi:hypothetical protein